jgi:hypothetical protein
MGSALDRLTTSGQLGAMTPEHLSALLGAANATTDHEGWQKPAESRTLTLHLAHQGAQLSVSRISSVRVDKELLFAKSTHGEEYVLVLDDVFAGSVEGLKDVSRKAGFV